MPTKAEVILAALEAKQKGHEERVAMELANFSKAIDRVEETAQEARDLATQTSSAVEQMPAKIIEAMEKKRKDNRMEGKDWVLFGFAAITLLAMLGDKFGLFK